MNKLNLTLLALVTVISVNQLLGASYNYVNKTPYKIKFRLVGNPTTDPITLQPAGSRDSNNQPLDTYSISIGSLTGQFHVDVDLDNWPENADLKKNTSSPCYNCFGGPGLRDRDAGDPYWGVGDYRSGWGIQFFGNPRGNFVLTDGHLRLAENI